MFVAVESLAPNKLSMLSFLIESFAALGVSSFKSSVTFVFAEKKKFCNSAFVNTSQNCNLAVLSNNLLTRAMSLAPGNSI